MAKVRPLEAKEQLIISYHFIISLCARVCACFNHFCYGLYPHERVFNKGNSVLFEYDSSYSSKISIIVTGAPISERLFKENYCFKSEFVLDICGFAVVYSNKPLAALLTAKRT